MGKSQASEARSPSTKGMAVCHPNAAGIDVGAKQIYVAVPEEGGDSAVRAFPTFTEDLTKLAEWLVQRGVGTVAMEATGVYWVPLYEILEKHNLEVYVVNAQHVRNVPGRKSDVLDCQWLQRLHCFGLLQGSFRPTAEIVELRQYLRQHQVHVKGAGSQVQRMQKALTLMNLQLHNVISDITGETGMKIIRAIVAGEQDAELLSRHRNYRCKATPETFKASLTGNYRREHLLALEHALKVYDLHQHLAYECHVAADVLLQTITATPEAAELPPLPPSPKKRNTSAPPVDYRTPVYMLTGGVDLTLVPGFSDYTVATLISEIGTDMSRWKTAKQFASWLRLVPRTTITGGKHKDRRKLPTTNRASAIFLRAALCASRGKTHIGETYRRFARRPDHALHAIAATAHKLARIVYRLLSDGVQYREPDPKQRSEAQRQRAIRSLKKKAEALGVELVEAVALP